MSALDVDVYKQETNSNQSQSVGCACFSETSRKKVLEFKSVPIHLNRTAPPPTLSWWLHRTQQQSSPRREKQCAMCFAMHWMTGELDSDLARKQKGPTGPIFQAKKATRADFLVQGKLFNHMYTSFHTPLGISGSSIWRNVNLIFQDEMYCILHRSHYMTRFLSLFSKYFVKYLKYFDKCRPPNGKEIRGLFAAIVHVQKGTERGHQAWSVIIAGIR